MVVKGTDNDLAVSCQTPDGLDEDAISSIYRRLREIPSWETRRADPPWMASPLLISLGTGSPQPPQLCFELHQELRSGRQKHGLDQVPVNKRRQLR